MAYDVWVRQLGHPARALVSQSHHTAEEARMLAQRHAADHGLPTPFYWTVKPNGTWESVSSSKYVYEVGWQCWETHGP